MATSLSIAQVAAQIPANERRLYRIWRAIPTGPLTERELEETIAAAADRPGDHAFAAAIRANLQMPTPVRVDGELVYQYAMTVGKDDQGKLVYQRSAEYPVGEDASFGTPAFNEVLAARAEREKEELDRLDADRQRQRDESPWAIEQKDRAEQVREVIRAEGGALLGEVIREETRAAVLELLSDLDQSTAARLRAQLAQREGRNVAA